MNDLADGRASTTRQENSSAAPTQKPGHENPVRCGEKVGLVDRPFTKVNLVDVPVESEVGEDSNSLGTAQR